MTCDIRPATPVHDPRNRGVCHAVPDCDLTIGVTRRAKGVNGSHLVGGQDCLGAPLAVDGLGHRIEMVWVDAIPSPAQVVERHAFRDRTTLALIDESVGTLGIGHAVPIRGASAVPMPAPRAGIHDVLGSIDPLICGNTACPTAVMQTVRTPQPADHGELGVEVVTRQNLTTGTARTGRLWGHESDSLHESEECRAGGDSQSLPGFRTPPFYHFQAQTGVRFEPLPGERHPLEEDE